MVIATNKRIAHRWSHYEGDVRAGLPLGSIRGPNTLDELMTVVEISYDPETDTTTAGWDWTRVEDYPAHEDYPWGDVT